MNYHIIKRHHGLTPEGSAQCDALEAALKAKGVKVQVSTSETFNPPSIEPNTIFIVMGGDGTMLNVAKQVAPAPVLGINLGRLGFITDIPGNFDPKLLATLLNNEAYETEHRFLLKVIEERNPAREHLALNDMTLKATGGKLIDVALTINGERAYAMRSDGVILSTPTGSTAYNLSAGGPIMHARMAAICITPLHPQTLSNRPIIIPCAIDGRTSKIEVVVKGQAELLNDGVAVWDHPMTQTTERKYVVTPSNIGATFLHVKSDAFRSSYFEGLRTKLNWFLPPC